MLLLALTQKQPLQVLLKISQNSPENTCARVSFLIKLQGPACNFIKTETLAQVFSCELWEIFKNSYFKEHLQTLFLLIPDRY